MKKFLSIILSFLVFSCVLTSFPQSVLASALSVPLSSSISYDYLSDGSYFETTIEYLPSARGTVIGASKTTVYKNASGQSLWYVKVTANFTYNGSSAKCTSSSASAGSYVDSWKILSKSSSKNGNSASATAVAAYYVNNAAIGSYSRTVTLHCNGNGDVS